MIVRDPPVDPLSDALAIVRARTTASVRLTTGGAWSLRFNTNHAKFNVVRAGRCWLIPESEPARELRAGDCFVTSGACFVLASDLDLVPTEASVAFAADPSEARWGGVEVEFLGGSMSFDDAQADLLLAVLPKVLVIEAETISATPMAWLIEQLDKEWRAALPGARAACDDIMRLLFLHAMRRHLELLGDASAPGWLSGLSDPNLAAALRAVHADPAKHWRMEQLAALAGQSRSTFAERFSQRVGIPPVEYATRWRMQIAAARLRTTSESIARIAEAFGYLSDSSFAATFRRVMGASPGAYRRAQREALV